MPKLKFIEGAGDEAIADWIAQRLEAALATSSDDIAINVPGGSTPLPVLDYLAARRLPWHRIAVWPGDDRIVEEDHPASNLGKIRARLEPAGAEIVPLMEDAQPPHFALTWLGMGTDGHIASLFPNTDPCADDRRPVRRLTPDPLPPEAPFDRLSLTIPSLVDSDEVVFLIRGAEKRAIFEAAAKGERDLPVARLLGAARRCVTVFC
jgi:6-phosphogluconolactonase